jgi:hypothetical protein
MDISYNGRYFEMWISPILGHALDQDPLHPFGIQRDESPVGRKGKFPSVDEMAFLGEMLSVLA